MTDARDLAAWLAAQDTDVLTALFAAREVSHRASWRDFFDAAEALLEPASITRGLSTLAYDDAITLTQLAAGTTLAPRDGLVSAALTRADGTIYTAVADVVQHTEVPEPAAEAIDDDEPVARAAERAFTTISQLADLSSNMLASPLSRTGTGATSAVERRRLVDAGLVEEADDIEVLLSIATAAGLVRSVTKHWFVTAEGAQWLTLSNRERWQVVATAVVRALPAGLRTATGTLAPAASWPVAYPWQSEWPARAAGLRTAATKLGVFRSNGEVTPWALGLAAGSEADLAAIDEYLPHEVTQIYLQNDLTAISPGPLAAALDARLRTMAIRESHAQASTYRFTAATLLDAFTGGETAESMTEFLGTISLTGVPQPLAYLIAESGKKHGAIRVHTDQSSGRTIITSESATLLDTLAVDQALRPLGLVRTESNLTTRASRDVVGIALADAHYPVTLVSPDGTPEPLQRHRLAPAPEPAPAPYGELVETLRESASDNSDSAWLHRELDLAVRQRAVLTVTVAVPGAEERTFTLEAAGLGGGRLRGRDRAADVERTLPVSHIVRVAVIE